ncbi:replication protein, partial [Blautia producta]
MSNLLYNKRPLIVNPELSCIIGLNEAIILQQVHYWIEKKKESKIDFHDGRYWVYNTYEGWQNQFPFWSISTIRRTISKLEKIGLLLSGNYNRLGIDKTKWYTINYKLVNELKNYKKPFPSDQNEQMDCSHYTDTSHQNEHTITRNYTEIIPESIELNGVVLKHNTCVYDPKILERQIIKSCKKNGISQYNQEQYIKI